MKKLSALLMGIVMVFSLAACNHTSPSSSSSLESSTPESSSSSGEESSRPSSGSASETQTEAGKTLVVYFSATGNTEAAAKYIAEVTGADLFELEPVVPYTDEDLNYSNEDSRVTREHDNPDERDVELVATTVDQWDSYDTVFIGYPKIQYGFLSV